MRSATVFNFVIEATLMGSVMILLMLAVRRFLRRQLGSRLICFAWLLVAARLLIPLALPNPMMNELRPAWSDNVGVRPIADQVRVRVTDALFDLGRSLEGAGGYREPSAVSQAVSGMGAQLSYGHLARWLLLGYACAALATAGWMIWQNARFMKKLRQGRVEALCGEEFARYRLLCAQRKVKPIPVYWVDPLPSACLVGVFRPYIALPLTLNRRELPQVLAHELCHKRAGDHWWGLVRNACCVLHWFNPLVWLAARLSRADQEMACDERVTACMDDDDRLAYANALALAAARRNAPEMTVLATGMTMKGRHIKQRIRAIVDGRPAVRWLCAAALCVACAGTLLAFSTAEQLEPLPSPVAPQWAAGGFTPRAITSEQEAVDYVRSIFSSAPYLNAASLTPFDSLDDLTYQAGYVPTSGLWNVVTQSGQSGAGQFPLTFDGAGKLWEITDLSADIVHWPDDGDGQSTFEYANPSYRTDAVYSAVIYDFVRSWAALMLPGETFDALSIDSDALYNGKRRVNVHCHDGSPDRSCDFYLLIGKEMYMAGFSRWDRAAWEAQEQAYAESAQQQAQDMAAVSQRRDNGFVPLSAMEPGSELRALAESGMGSLTEVYGYTAQDADRFVFALEEQNGRRYLLYHDADHPEWNYVTDAAAPASSTRTPFTSLSGSHQGESGIRQFWYKVEEAGWMTGWQEDDRAALLETAADDLCAIPLPEDAKAAIRTGSMTPAQTVQAAFEAYYGPEAGWSDALAGWRDETVMRFETSDHP